MKKRSITILFAILICMAGTKAFAYEYTYDIAVENAEGVTIYYNYINDGKELEVTYGGYYSHTDLVVSFYFGNVIIPEQVTHMNRTWKVTKIGNRAFENSSELISVTIPNSVNSFGKAVFSGCYKLTSVNIPSNVTRIENAMFCWCRSLSSFTIPANITSIGKYAFAYCSGMTSIYIPETVTEIETGAFQSCSDLTAVVFPSNIKSIESQTFSWCSKLSSFTIPENISSIGESAFYGCKSLKTINIPNTITVLNRSLFMESGLESITIPSSVMTIGMEAFRGCRDLISITIPNSVKEIGSLAFYESGRLTKITSLIEEPFAIGDDTFANKSYMDASLLVPKGTIDKYKQLGGWNNFASIEEDTDEGGPTILNKCEKPVLIQGQGGMFTIQGVDEGADIAVYAVSGQMVGSTKACGTQTSLATNIKKGEVAIIKIGKKSVKVVMQ